MSGSTDTPLLSIRNLRVAFDTQSGSREVLHGVSLDVFPGETVAIVGESGSGKSTTASAVVNLLPGTGHVTSGSIMLDGRELTELTPGQMEKVRGREIGYVPQDPMSNLNPVWSIGFQVKEAIRANGIASGRQAVTERAVEVLKQAGLADAEKRLHQYPHQFSGGMRQRALIGIGLAADPKLLIADEPTSALDVTVQRVILDHMASLTREKGTAVLLITHDLGLAAERASKIIVMQQGEIVEAGPSREILQNPLHPYTQRLVAAAPSIASQRLQAVAESRGIETSEDLAALPPTVRVTDLTKDYKIRQGRSTAPTSRSSPTATRSRCGDGCSRSSRTRTDRSTRSATSATRSPSRSTSTMSATRRRDARACASCWIRCRCRRISRPATRASCRAGSASASPSRAPWPSSPTSWCSTKRCRRSTCLCRTRSCSCSRNSSPSSA
ncbi:MAG: gsiA 3 [Microbacterium sp.]|nr:gsiA 3 [Microbacterium sp.]